MVANFALRIRKEQTTFAYNWKSVENHLYNIHNEHVCRPSVHTTSYFNTKRTIKLRNFYKFLSSSKAQQLTNLLIGPQYIYRVTHFISKRYIIYTKNTLLIILYYCNRILIYAATPLYTQRPQLNNKRFPEYIVDYVCRYHILYTPMYGFTQKLCV